MARTEELFRIKHRGFTNPGLVTIVVPVHNTPHDLFSACLESIKNQDYERVQLVVVDDFSDPRTCTVSIAQIYKPSMVLCLPANSGACFARNTGWMSGSGEFTMFFDADDFLVPNAISSLLAQLRSTPHASLAYSNFTRDGKLFKAGPFTLKQMLYQNKVAMPALIKTDHFVGFDPRIPRGQDWDAWLRILKLGMTATKCDKALFKVNTRSSGRISNSVSWKQYISTIRKHHPDITR